MPSATDANDPKCKYGTDMLLKINDTIYTKGDVSCVCKIPPFLTCTKGYLFLLSLCMKKKKNINLDNYFFFIAIIDDCLFSGEKIERQENSRPIREE